MKPRIVITGAGAVSPLGFDLPSIAANVGRSPEAAGSGARHAVGEAATLWLLNGLEQTSRLSNRIKRKLDPFCIYGMEAADMALAASGISAAGVDPYRVGIYVGNCLAGWGYTEPQLKSLHTQGISHMGPYVATAWFPAALQGQISLVHGFKGHSKTFSARDIAGLQAIGHAAQTLQRGRADVILCGASEHLGSPYVRAVLERLCQSQQPERGPFGRARLGRFAEGAAFLVLETEEHAQRRNATIWAQVSGFADRFCGEPEQAAEVLEKAQRETLARGEGKALLLRDGVFDQEGALNGAARRGDSREVVEIDPRDALGLQFAVSGVMEAALAAQALRDGQLTASRFGAANDHGPFSHALIQRLSSQGQVTNLCLGVA